MYIKDQHRKDGTNIKCVVRYFNKGRKKKKKVQSIDRPRREEKVSLLVERRGLGRKRNRQEVN